jgi:competence protein ComEA
MSRPRVLIVLMLFVGIGFALWRWRRGQPTDLSLPTALPPLTRTPAPALAASPDTPMAGGPRRIVNRVHGGAPPTASLRVAPAAPPDAEEPPPPSEPPATHEQSLAPLSPEEAMAPPAEPEPPATHESLAPLSPEEAPDRPAAPGAIAGEILSAAATAPAGPLNINTAEAQALIDLPGIGPALAARIIAHRERHGPFANIDQLVAIQGIGPTSLNEFRHLITV